MADDSLRGVEEVTHKGQRYTLVDLPPLTAAEERRSERFVRVLVGRMWKRILGEYASAHRSS